LAEWCGLWRSDQLWQPLLGGIVRVLAARPAASTEPTAAVTAFVRAVDVTTNPAERALLLPPCGAGLFGRDIRGARRGGLSLALLTWDDA
jgi:hypothetical protein